MRDSSGVIANMRIANMRDFIACVIAMICVAPFFPLNITNPADAFWFFTISAILATVLMTVAGSQES